MSTVDDMKHIQELVDCELELPFLTALADHAKEERKKAKEARYQNMPASAPRPTLWQRFKDYWNF